MAFTKDDKDYLGLVVSNAVQPLQEGLARLEKQFDDHDDKTADIEKIQDQMIGAIKIVAIAVLPIFCSVVTWWFTKG